ncbi:hypothetical protein ACFVXE_31130 [Streptomyces sp. NPDC058231]|uniref:hypothetical protein n=1 Tax=Streptomyces sp. NPDC058231 TaxID=3346392 RepID=UPI0036E85E02
MSFRSGDHAEPRCLPDIHAVLPAPEAVPAEPEVRAAGRIVLVGDIAAGPQPAQVPDLLTAQDGPRRPDRRRRGP